MLAKLDAEVGVRPDLTGSRVVPVTFIILMLVLLFVYLLLNTDFIFDI